MDAERRDRIAQWAYDTRPILGRFHLWLDDVELQRVTGDDDGEAAFVGPSLERSFITATAVTALGTRLFGRYGEGENLDKSGLNRIKKDADAVSAYALSEGLWYLTRHLPENHAVLVCLGEGLMPKGGESPEMGSNPLVGFGRVYARPQVARFLDRRVHRLINDPRYRWDDFWREVERQGLTVWGAAVDTLENTSRFARGAGSGPMTVLHLFDHPLRVSRPYEGYVGNLVLPRAVVDTAERRSTLIAYHTPRRLVLEAIRETYPSLPTRRIHVWTLGGAVREKRLGSLWREWRDLGVHLVEPRWRLPGGGESFTESGTYAPVSCVGLHTDEGGDEHLFLCDGYAASAEAIQAASLDPVLGCRTAVCLFSSRFVLDQERERRVMELDPDAPSFPERLAEVFGRDPESRELAAYSDSLRDARDAGMPLGKLSLGIDDFFPRKRWRVLALAGYVLDDPYSGCSGIERLADDLYRVTVRSSSRQRIDEVRLTLRLTESFDDSRLIFSPLIDRFYAGQDYRLRTVKISDSGRIRNELQTLCLEALEHFGDGGIRIHFDRLDDRVMPPDKQRLIREVLEWYKLRHPTWFRWLEIAD